MNNNIELTDETELDELYNIREIRIQVFIRTFQYIFALTSFLTISMIFM